MEIVKVIEMETIDRDYIQFLNFELISYKSILSHILLEKTKGYSYSVENYKHFMNEYKEAEIKYNLAHMAFVRKYAPEYYGNLDYEVNYEFETREMIIRKGDK